MADVLDFSAAARRASTGWHKILIDLDANSFRVLLMKTPAVAGDRPNLGLVDRFASWREALDCAVSVGGAHGGLPLLDLAAVRHGDITRLRPEANGVVLREGRNGFDVLIAPPGGEWNAACFSDSDRHKALDRARALAAHFRLPLKDRTGDIA